VAGEEWVREENGKLVGRRDSRVMNFEDWFSLGGGGSIEEGFFSSRAVTCFFGG
jgi:hypothetical protein